MEDLRLDSLEGVGPVTTRKLSDAGIHNIMDLIVRGPVEIAEVTGMDKETAEKIVTVPTFPWYLLCGIPLCCRGSIMTKALSPS